MDLDGTLIAGDLFWESLLRLLIARPWLFVAVPAWALKGRAFLKRQVAKRVALDVTALPYRQELVERLRDARDNGDHVVLATAADEIYARDVSAHLGLFSQTFASDGHVNLKGSQKAARLRAEFGEGKFHYIGNGWADVPVWRAAGVATIVAGPERLVRHVETRMRLGAVIGTTSSKLWPLLRALRPHQWAKNLLVFVPLVTSHRLVDLPLVIQALVAFISFGFAASAIYVINDLFDIQSDRAHPTKRRRPFAAGELSVPTGVALAAILLVAAGTAAAVGTTKEFLAALGVYALLTTAYSARLKREPVLDVLMLASLYVLRVIGGGAAVGIEISNWLLGFALFLFLSLAFVKRYTELLGQNGNMPGRGYSAEDGPWMLSIGTSAGYMAVVILALYVNSTDVAALYHAPRALWLLCPLLLFWMTRLWLRAGRRQLHDDPVFEALKDPVSYYCAVAAVGVLLVAV